MVRSIRFWMKAFNLLTNEDQLTEFAHRIFDDINGYDPYLEDEATLWLLHYELVKRDMHRHILSSLMNLEGRK